MYNNIFKELIDSNYFSSKNFFEKENSYLNFMRERTDRWLYLNNDMDQVIEYAKKFKENVKNLLRIADEVKDNVFLFDLRWDMERTYIPVKYEDEIKWNVRPFDDDEWVYMLNRHRYWICLGQAYAITKNESYAKTFFSQAESWIDNNPINERTVKTSWRTIEAGLRCENWIKSFMYFKDSKNLSSRFLYKFISSLIEHGEYLYNNYDPAKKLSNWGTLESHGLFILGVFLPEYKKSKEYINSSIDRLSEQAEYQIMTDGMHWEQSPMYLNEVLHCFLDTIILARKNNIELPENLLEKTHKLAYSNLYMARPNHRQVPQSDSDDTDIRDMLTKSAYVFKNGELKFGAYKHIDFDNIWDLGINSINEYNSIEIKIPLNTSYGFEDSGNYYMRSGWGKNDNYMFFHCGTLGSGHGHADLLHFNISGYGEDFLIDPGRYTYVEGNPYREYLKSCRAHNTTIIDDKEFTVINGSWSYFKAATPIKQSFISKDNFDYAEGGHLGYMDLENGGIFTNRKILYIKPDIWIVIDEFYGHGFHNYKQFFHFNTNKEIILNDNVISCKGENAKLEILQINNDIKRQIFDEPISKFYNKLEQAPTLACSIENEGFTSIITVLYLNEIKNNQKIIVNKIPISTCNGRKLKDWEGEAIKITLNDKEYTIIVCHNEIFKEKKLLKVENHYVYGKVILITEDKTNENVLKEVIKY